MIGTINIVEGGREKKEPLDYYGDKEASLHSMFPFLRLQSTSDLLSLCTGLSSHSQTQSNYAVACHSRA